MLRRRARSYAAAALLLTLAGCQHGAGRAAAAPDTKKAPERRAGALYPGADPKPAFEHVYFYPVEEALAAAQDVLEAHGYPVDQEGKDPTRLISRWRMFGRPSGAGQSENGSYQLRRYSVQGTALSPVHSVVRIFRIDREETYGDGQPPSDLVLSAQLAPNSQRRTDTGAVAAGGGAGAPAWHQWVASGLDAQRAAEAREIRRDKRGKDEQPDDGPFATAARPKSQDAFVLKLKRDPRFQNQWRMPTQDELRGSNERGVRDFPFEKELVQRLEQFPSLEFTGGPLDVAPAPAPPTAPAYSAAWEQEGGGLPFLKGGECGEPVRGLEALAAPGSVVLVGEPLGTREVPSAVGNMACQLATRGLPVVLGLSLARDEQEVLDNYLLSHGSRDDQDALLSTESWRRAPRDGRSSRALLVLIERLRRLRAAGLKVELVAYDVHDARDNAREEAVAELLRERHRAAPGAVMLVLGGNYHVRTDGGLLPWSSSFKPFGHRLVKAGLPVKSLDTAFSRGARWTCAVNRNNEAECRVYATAPTEQSYSPPGKALSVELFPGVSGDGFHGLLHVGAISASAPALLPADLVAERRAAAH